MANKSILNILVLNDLKVTPQRIAILEVILALENHPTAENITEHLRLAHPNISLATIYNTLETFSRKGIIRKVSTNNEVSRYDPVTERHHHLYCADSDRIEDFYDDDLNRILDEYMKSKKIPDFNIEDIKLQIIGTFTTDGKEKEPKNKNHK
jgi:Fur family transcriptional regulator, peroxide stress response regulator